MQVLFILSFFAVLGGALALCSLPQRFERCLFVAKYAMLTGMIMIVAIICYYHFTAA